MANAYSYTNYVTLSKMFDTVLNKIRLIPYSDLVRVDAQWESNLPGLALQYLGTELRWWVLLMYNGLYDPIDDVVPGIILKIPDRNSLEDLLGSTTATQGTQYVV